ncbi:hypothetical protein M0804_008002 [Polistes exclamans]|nr:hypothetical protein M0804_008002 [Polistes exclamans]
MKVQRMYNHLEQCHQSNATRAMPPEPAAHLPRWKHFDDPSDIGKVGLDSIYYSTVQTSLLPLQSDHRNG